MQRFVPYLGIVAALLVALFIAAFSSDMTVVRAPAADSPTASSTPIVIPDISLPALTLPSLEPKTSVSTTSEEQATLAPKKAAPDPEPIPVAAPVAVLPAPSVQAGNADLDTAAAALRAALVNIICYAPAGSGLHSTSGSGVFIDSKGIILTNAHVALNLLLADRGVSCTIRSGSPALNRYTAALIYIPTAWLNANEDILTKSSPHGTGEYDFAFLAVTGSTGGDILPGSFPSLPLAETPPLAGTPVVIASYGAQFLESSQVQSALFPTLVFGSVKDVYTFARNTIDILALGGSAAAQEGSSGGGVADASGKLVGTITTSTVEGDTSTRFLDAITASYIRGEYASETAEALDLLLARDPATAAADFAPQIPALASLLTAHLP